MRDSIGVIHACQDQIYDVVGISFDGKLLTIFCNKLNFCAGSSYRSDRVVRRGPSFGQDIGGRSDLTWREAQISESLLTGRAKCQLSKIFGSAHEDLGPLRDKSVHELVLDHTIRFDLDVVLDGVHFRVVHSRGRVERINFIERIDAYCSWEYARLVPEAHRRRSGTSIYDTMLRSVLLSSTSSTVRRYGSDSVR
jgi:hypothetical protein